MIPKYATVGVKSPNGRLIIMNDIFFASGASYLLTFE